MNAHIKRSLAVFLAATFLLNFAIIFCSAEEADPTPGEPIEETVNTNTAIVYLSISDSGVVKIRIKCLGVPGTTHISSVTYLEKWTGTAWTRVSMNGASQISDGASAASLLRTYTTTVGSGQYRATAIFTVTNGTDETVTVRSDTVIH